MLEEYEKNLNKTTYEKVKSYWWGAVFTYALCKVIEGVAYVIFYPIIFIAMHTAKILHDKAPKSEIEKEVEKEQRLMIKDERAKERYDNKIEKEYKKQYITYKKGKKNVIIYTAQDQK